LSGRTDDNATSYGRSDLASAHSSETGKSRTKRTDETLAGSGSFTTWVVIAYTDCTTSSLVNASMSEFKVPDNADLKRLCISRNAVERISIRVRCCRGCLAIII
jgi:hypothetical protein